MAARKGAHRGVDGEARVLRPSRTSAVRRRRRRGRSPRRRWPPPGSTRRTRAQSCRRRCPASWRGAPAFPSSGAPRPAERKLAQRVQAIAAEEVVERHVRTVGRVDLARAQALLQRLRREVDEHDFVGVFEHPVGERLADADVGELGDRVVQTLDVLDVDGGDHVDPGVEDLVDVLPALFVASVPNVRVRELVDQARSDARRETASTSISSSSVRGARPPPRHHLEAVGVRRGPARSCVSRYPIATSAPQRAPPALLQHPVRLPHPGRHPEEDLGTTTHLLSLYAPSTPCTTRSISLIPTNGTITPPRP